MADCTARDVAQRGYSVALRRLADMKATKVAEAMGTSDATISTLKNQHLEQCLLLLAHLGLKVVDAKARCLAPDAFTFLTSTHQRVMQQAPQLVWEEDKE